MALQRGDLAGLAILVVDKDDDGREIVRRLLQYFGALPLVAATAREGLSVLREVRPDLVIAEMRLGDHDATWLLRQLRRLGGGVPVIAISAEDFDESRLQAAGFFAYLRKPVASKQLLETVALAVNRD